jgi:hypothetical protein
MGLRNLILQAEVIEQCFRAVVSPHHDQQASDDENPTEHGQDHFSSNMLLPNLILLIGVTFLTPTPVIVNRVFSAQTSETKGASACRASSSQSLRSPLPAGRKESYRKGWATFASKPARRLFRPATL